MEKDGLWGERAGKRLIQNIGKKRNSGLWWLMSKQACSIVVERDEDWEVYKRNWNVVSPKLKRVFGTSTCKAQNSQA